MKFKKFLNFLICMVLIVPVILLSGCKDKDKDKDKGSGNDDDAVEATGMLVSLDATLGEGLDVEEKTITTEYTTTVWSIDETYFDVVIEYSDDTTKEVFTQNTEDADNYTLTITPAIDKTKPVSAGEYSMKFEWGDFEETYTWVVEKKEIDLSGYTWQGQSEYTYNKSVQQVTFVQQGGYPEELFKVVTPNDSVNSATTAGLYTAKVEFVYDEANVVLKNAPATEFEWKIKKGNLKDYINKELFWVVDQNDSRTYIKDTSQTVKKDNAADLLEDYAIGVSIVRYDGVIDATNAGTYTAKVVLAQADTANWETLSSSDFDFVWTIKPCQIDVSKANWGISPNIEYTGDAQSVALDVSTVYLPEENLIQVSYVTDLPNNVTSTATNAGTYTAKANITCSNSNYVLVNNKTFTAEWTINKYTINKNRVAGLFTWTGDNYVTYDGTEKSVTTSAVDYFEALFGADCVTYHNATARTAGTRTAYLSVEYDQTNYLITEDAIQELSYDWTIKKATYHFEGYLEVQSFIYNGSEKVVTFAVAGSLPAGVTISEYAGEWKATEPGVYTARLKFTQTDTTNYNLIDEDKYVYTWVIYKEEFINSFTVSKADGGSAVLNQYDFETLNVLPYDSTVEIALNTGYTMLINEQDVSEFNTADYVNNWIRIRILKEEQDVYYKEYKVEALAGISYNGTELYFNDSNEIAIELEDELPCIKYASFLNSIVTSESIVEKYADRIYVGTNPDDMVKLTDEYLTFELSEDSNNFTIIIQDQGGQEAYSYRVIFRKPTYLKEYTTNVVYLDSSTEELTMEAESGGMGISGFYTSFEAELKDGLNGFTLKVLNPDGTEFNNEQLLNVEGDVYLQVVVMNTVGKVVEERYINLSYFGQRIDSSDMFRMFGYHFTTETTVTLENAKINGSATPTLTPGVNKYALVSTIEHASKTYTRTEYVIINSSPAANEYFTMAYLAYGDADELEFEMFDLEANNADSTYGIDSIYHLTSENLYEELVDGVTLVSKTFVHENQVYYAKYIVNDGTKDVTITFYIPTAIVYDADISVEGAYITSAVSGDIIAEVELSETAATEIKNMTTLSTLSVEATNESAKLELLDSEGEVLMVEFGTIYAHFTENGNYSIRITSSDETATKTYALKVEGEFAPLFSLTYNETTLKMEFVGSMPEGNMEMTMGINPIDFPQSMIETLEEQGLNLEGFMGFVGYLDIDMTDITSSLIVDIACALDQVFTLEGVEITERDNIEITIYTDSATGSKYVALMSNMEETVVGIVIYLHEKVYPLEIVIGEGNDAQTAHYQLNMFGMDNINMHNGDFELGQTGMTASLSKEGLNLSGNTANLEVTFNFGRVFDDLSYIVMILDGSDPEAEPTIIMPTLDGTTYTMSFDQELTFVKDGNIYSTTFYVALPGADLEHIEEMIMPVTIVLA